MMTYTMKDKKYQLLQQFWGHKQFRSKQEEIIDHLLDKRDCLVIMPTGGGKSLCYQLPALLSEGTTIVISPLIALIEDQVTALTQNGVNAAALHSNLSAQQLSTTEQNLLDGKLKLLYISPEKANSRAMWELLQKINISFFAIDEAHCVSIWGNDFRPDYIQLKNLKLNFPSVPTIALTATADASTQLDIAKQLGLIDAKIFVSSFERKNIKVAASTSENKYKRVSQFVHSNQGKSGIIYCLSRKETEKLAAKLQSEGILCDYYHAGMDASNRSKVQRRFQDDQLQLICATIAFGMGIDKSNIRWVIHYSMPKTIESYYQEIGRSGRDGLPAESLLFYNWGDFIQQKKFIDDSNAPDEFKHVQNAKLARMWEFASAYECRTNLVLNYFGEYRSSKCNHCDNCLEPHKGIDGTAITQKALSAIVRCNENITSTNLIDILRGSAKADIVDNGWDKIKTFGAGRDISFIHWKIYLTQLINLGYIAVDMTNGFTLKTTPLSKSVLFENTQVALIDPNVETEFVKSKEEPKKSKKIAFNDELLTKLKEWRLQQANAINAPAYVIFSDKVLGEIVKNKPLDQISLSKIDGIGNIKINKYGADIISLISNYVQNQTHLKKVPGQTFLETLSLIQNGMSIENIAQHRNLNTSTIYGHLAILYSKELIKDLSPWINDAEVNIVEKAWIDAQKPMALSPIAEHISQPIAFEKIRLSVAIIFKKYGIT